MLNTFLKKYCINSIKEKNFIELSEKSVVIDISIILYKFKKNNKLTESIKLFCEKIKKYNINALFVFDGKSPEDKYNERKNRSKKKKEYEMLYNEIMKELDDGILEYNKMIEYKLKNLKEKFTRIQTEDIEKVKSILNEYNIQYEVAECEADEVCGKYANNNYQCISDDTDMFMYGCPIIIREIDIENEKYTEYNLKSILKTLNISKYNFKQLCILSGTDYIKHTSKELNIFTFYEKYKKMINNSKSYFNNCLFKYTINTHNVSFDSLKNEMSKYHTSKYHKSNISNNIMSWR